MRFTVVATLKSLTSKAPRIPPELPPSGSPPFRIAPRCIGANR